LKEIQNHSGYVMRARARIPDLWAACLEEGFAAALEAGALIELAGRWYTGLAQSLLGLRLRDQIRV
jgi:hypothetical protein